MHVGFRLFVSQDMVSLFLTYESEYLNKELNIYLEVLYQEQSQVNVKLVVFHIRTTHSAQRE